MNVELPNKSWVCRAISEKNASDMWILEGMNGLLHTKQPHTVESSMKQGGVNTETICHLPACSRKDGNLPNHDQMLFFAI